MFSLRKVNEDLKTIKYIATIASVYQEIAQIKMREIRERVLENRAFLEEISKVYQKAVNAYLALLEKEKRKIPIFKKGKKIIVVFLSANQPFYGPLILNTWQSCYTFLKKEKSDLLVVGRIGKYLAETAGFGHKLYYFEMSDDRPEKEVIKEIVQLIKDYERVIVFYGKYQSVARQEIAKSEISFRMPEKRGESEFYIFEPSPKEILEFFETEIFSALFNQTILEHQLAKFASRMIAMYKATENARKMEKALELKKRKLQKQEKNKKQINLFLGQNLWQKEAG